MTRIREEEECRKTAFEHVLQLLIPQNILLF